jgi:hypothetical protein
MHMADFKQSRAVIEHRPAKVGEEIIYQGTVYRVVDRGKSYVTALDKRIGTFTIDDGQYAVISHETNNVNNLTVKLDIDASDAITALKALQREARKATQALRELEAEVKKLPPTQADTDIEKIAKELAEKLRVSKFD